MNEHNVQRRGGPLFDAKFNTIAEPLFNTKYHKLKIQHQNRKYKLLQDPLVNFPINKANKNGCRST